MRTTLTIDDDLLRTYKQRAAQKGTTLSTEVERDLRFALLQSEQTPRRPFRLLTVGGPARPGIDTLSNVAMLDEADAEDDLR